MEMCFVVLELRTIEKGLDGVGRRAGGYCAPALLGPHQ